MMMTANAPDIDGSLCRDFKCFDVSVGHQISRQIFFLKEASKQASNDRCTQIMHSDTDISRAWHRIRRIFFLKKRSKQTSKQ